VFDPKLKEVTAERTENKINIFVCTLVKLSEEKSNQETHIEK